MVLVHVSYVGSWHVHHSKSPLATRLEGCHLGFLSSHRVVAVSFVRAVHALHRCVLW